MLPAVTPKNRFGLPSALKRLGRLPVGLRDDADAEALRLEQPADDRHAEARMVDIGVAGHQHDVAAVPAERRPSRRATSAGTAPAQTGAPNTCDRRKDPWPRAWGILERSAIGCQLGRQSCDAPRAHRRPMTGGERLCWGRQLTARYRFTSENGASAVPVRYSGGSRIASVLVSLNCSRSLLLMFWNCTSSTRGFDHSPSLP